MDTPFPRIVRRTLLAALWVFVGSACATATVTLKSGERVSGDYRGEDDWSLRLRVERRVSSAEVLEDYELEATDDGASKATLLVPLSDIELVEEQDVVALVFAIGGTVLAVGGLAALYPAVEESRNCSPRWCSTGEALLGLDIAVLVVGVVMAVPSWYAYSTNTRTRSGAELTPKAGGLAVVF